jgi:hypothetical protein
LALGGEFALEPALRAAKGVGHQPLLEYAFRVDYATVVVADTIVRDEDNLELGGLSGWRFQE